MTSNIEVLLSALPMLEAMQLDNVKLADDYLHCQWGDFHTRLLLRVAYEFGRKLQAYPGTKSFELTRLDSKDPINLALRYIQDEVEHDHKKLVALHPSIFSLEMLDGKQMSDAAVLLAHPFAVKNGLYLSDVPIEIANAYMTSTHDELFDACKYLLASRTDIMMVYATFLIGVVEVWMELNLEEQMWFPDLSEQIGELHDAMDAGLKKRSNVIMRILGDDARKADDLLDDVRKSIPYDNRSFAQMLELYLMPNIGMAPSHYSKRMMQILDYYVNLMIGGM